MQLAVENNSISNEDIFWRTQFPELEGTEVSIEIWSANQDKCFVRRGNALTSADTTDIQFLSEKVGILLHSTGLPFEKGIDRLSSLLAWKEANWDSKLKLLGLLYEISLLSENFNWVGIYRINPKDSEELLVSGFIGDPTPHRRIPIDQGICGAAVREGATLNIPNVKDDDRYLSCSIHTKSELVVPLRNADGIITAELDIDCRVRDGFSGALENQIHRICERIERIPNLI